MSAQLPQHTPSAAQGTPSGSVSSGSINPLTSEQQKQDGADVYAPNIVIYGETGVGKSSTINLIAGRDLAHTSNGALGCTFQHERYTVELNGMSCALWDTMGLDEGTEGTVPAAEAEHHLKSLIQELANTGGIHLVVYCIRATRLSRALKHNYDLFYVTVCRKKVPIALVVTGLEHQQGEMETWWTANEAVLRRCGMRFDEHACVTTLDIQDDAIQERRSDSQRRLRELMIKYSGLSAWKTDSSFISLILPMFRTFLRRKTSGRAKKSTTIRKVITCGVASPNNISTPTPLSPDTTTPWRIDADQIGDRQYEFVRIDRRALVTPTRLEVQRSGVMAGAGVLVFYTSPLLNGDIPSEEVDMLEEFYEMAGGQTCPVIVVLQGCDDEEQAIQGFHNAVASHKNIQAYTTTLPDQVPEMIERLCIEYIEVKTSIVSRLYAATRQLFVPAVEVITSLDYLRRMRHRRSTLDASPVP